MITCDLCGKAQQCLQKEIEGKEYDVCPECWNPLEDKLKEDAGTLDPELPERLVGAMRKIGWALWSACLDDGLALSLLVLAAGSRLSQPGCRGPRRRSHGPGRSR